MPFLLSMAWTGGEERKGREGAAPSLCSVLGNSGTAAVAATVATGRERQQE